MYQNENTKFCSANFIVISTIPILFFIGIFMGYIGLIPLNVPIHSLGVIGFIMFVFLLFTRHNANYSVCKMRSSYDDLEEKLNNELIANTLVIEGKKKSILKLENFLNNYYKDIRNDNFVSVASSIFPMLGILGTFIAIALSMPNFSVSDTKALDHEISILLNGVGSAFFASIYGILLSLIWTYFEKRGLSKIDHYFTQIKHAYETKLWSDEELLIYKYSQYDIKENKFIGALKDVFNIDLIKEINQQLDSSSKTLVEALEKLHTDKEALKAQQDIVHTIKEFNEATNSFEKTTKVFSAQLNNSLNRTFEKIDTEVGEIVIKLADFATHVSLESKEVQESIKRYHDMVANHTKMK